MRAPRIRAKLLEASLGLKNDKKPQDISCSICRKICLDERRILFNQCNMLTRSTSKWIEDMNKKRIIIYETYRCMPLLGDEKVHAPDWDEHIVRYHIVFVENKS